MPAKNGKFTPAENTFISAYVRSGDAEYASDKAGYKFGAASAAAKLKNPAVQAAIREAQQSRLVDEGLELCVDTWFSIMRNVNAPAAARVKAGQIVWEKANVGNGADDKPLSEMTFAELANVVAKHSRVLEPALELEVIVDPFE